MKVAVLGATGKEGQLLLAEAKRRGNGRDSHRS